MTVCNIAGGVKPRDNTQLAQSTTRRIVNSMERLNQIKQQHDNLLKVIVANTMYRIAKTILHTYGNDDDEVAIDECELFKRLSGMIADILAACLTNIPHVITLMCVKSEIEKREASIVVAVNLLGKSTGIIRRLESRPPYMDRDKMAYIDE